MSGGKDEENVLRMTKEDLQHWIQAEVERNPQLMQRHEQLVQVEEWVKQKEREATYTRLLYSNACESVLECESVMKGLYGMLGLEYRDVDSEEEGEGSRELHDVIQITDDEGVGKKKSDCDDDIVVIDLGVTKETLEPMLEKVNMAIERSSKLVQDLAQRVTKATSICSESSSDIISRPSSISSPETSSFESITPAPINQQNLAESLELTENSIAIIKTESLSMETSSAEMSLLSNSTEQCENIAKHNSDFTATMKTEPQLTALSPSEISSTTVSNNCSSIASIKTEPQLTAVTPEISSPSSNSEQFKTSVCQNSDAKATIKTEPQAMPATPETPLLPSNSELFTTISNHNSANRATIKTEPQFMPLTSSMSSSPSGLEQFETTAYNSYSIETIKTEPSLKTLKTDKSFHKSNSNQPETIPQHSLDSKAAIKTEPQLTMTSEMSSLPSNSEQPKTNPRHDSESISTVNNSEEEKTMSGHKSESIDKKAAKRKKSTVPSAPPLPRLRSSTTTSPVTNTPSPQSTRSSSPSPSDSDYEPDSQTDSDDPPYSPSETSKSKTIPVPKPIVNNTSSNAVPVPSSTIKQPAASAGPSAASQISPVSSSKSSESSETCKEIELKVDAEVLGKWKNNIWHQGTVRETQKTESGHTYTVEFKDGKQCLLPAHHVACLNSPMLKELFVGCRVVGCCKEDEGKTWFNGAVLGELPDRKNRMRFLVFYDDGRVAYLALPDLHLVCKQLSKVWTDIENEICRSQVEEYLRVYPNPIAVVLRVGQETKAERNGKFEPCTVLQLDGNLIQICFKGDKQKEWLYKGSDKLEHIVTIKKRLAQQKTQQSTKAGGNIVSQCKTPATVASTQKSDAAVTKTPSTSLQNTSSAVSPEHVTRQTNAAVTKTPSTSPKNTSSVVSSTHVTRQSDSPVTETPSTSPQNTSPAVSPACVTQQTDAAVTKTPSTSPQNTSTTVSPACVTRQTDITNTKIPSISLKYASSVKFQPRVVLQKMAMPLSIRSRSGKRPAPDEVEEQVSKKDQTKSTYLYHRCCPACLDGVRPTQVDMHRGQNPLLIPLLFNFRRMTARRRLDGNVYFHIFYRSPCGRSLCEMQEVQEYLFETRCDFLFLEMFCMDPFLLVNRARPPSISTSQPHLYLPDISEGREVLPVPCINEVDHTPAPIIRYTRHRIPAPGVSINTSLDFLTGCDCTDGCQDRAKCSCHQLTIEATSLCSGGPVDVTAGYTHKRLQKTLPTGVYECNPLCRCDPRICTNRLVQHGLQLRLELFMTQHKGWGIRCKDDLAKGTFVCVFTGKIVTEDKINEDDTVSGNEYLANLDFIEGVEKLKEGYESEAHCSDTETENNKKTITMKTGPLWKNTRFQDDSSSGEEKDEPMELDTEQDKMDVCDRSLRGKKRSHIPREISVATHKNLTILANQKRLDGQETSGPKRCFAIKSSQRRVKPLETSDAGAGKAQPAINTRRLFNGEEACYIIDARQEGNLGRFINHSCSPNLFVQNVFVDTHDLRFPWIAFFASKRIKAGTELTWDYNYEVGSVEGKVLLCCCGSPRCTGRLL